MFWNIAGSVDILGLEVLAREGAAWPNNSRGADAKTRSPGCSATVLTAKCPGLLRHSQMTGHDFSDMSSCPTQ